MPEDLEEFLDQFPLSSIASWAATDLQTCSEKGTPKHGMDNIHALTRMLKRRIEYSPNEHAFIAAPTINLFRSVAGKVNQVEGITKYIEDFLINLTKVQNCNKKLLVELSKKCLALSISAHEFEMKSRLRYVA